MESNDDGFCCNDFKNENGAHIFNFFFFVFDTFNHIVVQIDWGIRLSRGVLLFFRANS